MKPEPVRPISGRCDACPVRPGVRCKASDVPRMCELAAGGRSEQLRKIVEASGDTPEGPAAAPRFTPAQIADARRRTRAGVAVKKCPDRVPEPGCGCSGRATCKRDGASKTRQECYACVEAAGLVSIG
jgi:hypothetical protein